MLDFVFDFLTQAITEIFGDFFGRRFQRKRARRLATQGRVQCALRDAPAGGKEARWQRGTAKIGDQRIQFKSHDVVVESADLPGETRPAGGSESGMTLWFDPETRTLRITTPAGMHELAILESQAQWVINALGLPAR